MNKIIYCLFTSLFCLGACQEAKLHEKTNQSNEPLSSDTIKDWHTQANPKEVHLKHLSLDIRVDFDQQTIKGKATWFLDSSKTNADILLLDTRDLEIEKVVYSDGSPADFQLKEDVPFLGQALRIDLKPGLHSFTIFYQTKKDATALQWLNSNQTFGKNAPFLYTQSESIYARSWIPCPDGPGIRFTYEATVQVPAGLMALMSAENPQKKSTDGIYHFKMDQPIPAYLMALAVGDVGFKAIDNRTGVYAEPVILERAVHEFEDVGKMVHTAENLYGPYRWGRYDILVLPSGFPLGGMENPKLTFCTPTILAGDKSLVNLIAHELAHSWSGNLVTNATWNDFWLNEGFTVYFERRITEAQHGKDYVDMLWELGYQDLQATVEELGADSKDTWLKLHLKDRDPDIGLTDVAYEKGSAFLHLIEQTVGRENFDLFLNKYFETHAFQSIHTADFLNYLQKNLLKNKEEWENEIRINEWVYGPGIPNNFPMPERKRFEKVEIQIADFLNGKPASQLTTSDWSTYEWLHFLRQLPYPVSLAQMKDLDATFNFTKSENSEIADVWFLQSIRSNYAAAYPQMKYFLIHTGRAKFLEPLYKALMATPKGSQTAKEIYAIARENYHPLAQKEVEQILFPKKNKG